MDQIIDIATDGRHLSRARGFLKVSEDGTEIGRTPLDQIAGVIVHAHGTTWSTSLLTELADRGVPVVLCGPNHAPRAVLMPLEGHHAQGGRIRAQWQAKRPLLKRAWKQVITAKVEMQAAALEAVGEADAPLRMMIRRITSGDSTNIEAQAARYYWPRMMGKEFRARRECLGCECTIQLRLHRFARRHSAGCGSYRTSSIRWRASLEQGQCLRPRR